MRSRTCARDASTHAAIDVACSKSSREVAETPRESRRRSAEQTAKYLNAIGPIALASSLALAVGSTDRSGTAKALDAISAVGLAGVLGTTMLVTVPITRKLDVSRPIDYADDDTATMNRNFHRAHALRTAFGISAFICAAASNILRKR